MWMWLTIQCAVVCHPAVLSDGLLCSVREMDDDRIDDRCEEGSSSEGGHMLVVSDLVWSNLLVIFEIKENVGHGMKYKFMDN